jgi:hypothetical protein
MYTPVGVSQLSNTQISKLLNGHAVTVKHGSQHKLNLSQEQAKKLHKAGQRGAGIRIMLDPYQQQMQHHQVMRGSGLMSGLKKAYGKAKQVVGQARQAVGQAKQFYQENKEDLEPYMNIAKKAATRKVEQIQSKAAPKLTRYLGDELGSQLAEHAQRTALGVIDTFDHPAELGYQGPQVMTEQEVAEIEGSGFRRRNIQRKGGTINLKKIGQTIKSGVSKLGDMAVSKARDFANSPQGKALVADAANAAVMAAMSGAGMKLAKRGRAKPKPKRKGGALFAAGY